MPSTLASDSPQEAELIAAFGRYARDPLEFAYYAYPWGKGELDGIAGPREWQRNILECITDHLQSDSWAEPLCIAVSSGHGIGKSALIGMVSGWAMSCYEDARVNITANTGTQLDTKTWPEVSKWFRRLINAHWWNVKGESIAVRDKAHEENWRIDAVTWSENNPAAFAGLHNERKIIVLIMDESSEIADVVWETTEGALTDEDTVIIWLAFGNPTRNDGRFAECFGRFRHRWKRFQIDSRTVEGTNKAQFQKWVEDYGEDSDFVRVRVRGVFPRAGSTQFIASDVVYGAMHRDVPDQSRAYKIMSVDVARFGDDQSVIGQRQGLKLDVLKKLRGLDTYAVSQEVIFQIKAQVPRCVVIDGDGIGAGVVDNVNAWLKSPEGKQFLKGKEDWFRVHEFHGAGESGDVDMYYNQRAYVWGRTREWLRSGQIPNDPELEADLTTPKYFFSGKNQIQLEKKEDMKKRGKASPDNGDMLAMTFGADPVLETRDEALRRRLQETSDPTEQHFMRLRETERRKDVNRPLNYWE